MIDEYEFRKLKQEFRRCITEIVNSGFRNPCERREIYVDETKWRCMKNEYFVDEQCFGVCSMAQGTKWSVRRTSVVAGQGSAEETLQMNFGSHVNSVRRTRNMLWPKHILVHLTRSAVALM
jgi:hypothetical protein